MHRIKILLLSGLLIACLGEDGKKHPKTDSKFLPTSSPHNDKDHPSATAVPKTMKTPEKSKVVANDSKMDEPEESATVVEMRDKVADTKHEDMKSSSTVGLGFYPGVIPYGYPSYSVYPYYRYYPRPYWGYPWYRSHHYPWNPHRHHRHFY